MFRLTTTLKTFVLVLAFFIICGKIFAQNDKNTNYTIKTINHSSYNKSVDSIFPPDTIVGAYLPNYEMPYVSSDLFNYVNQVYYFSIAPDSLGNLGSVDANGVFSPIDSIASLKPDIDTLRSWRGSKQVKILITVGGWTQSKYFQKAMSKTSSRANLVAKVKSFCQAYGVDGAVIDWEAYQNTVVDSLYGFFINELRTAFTSTPLLISVAISPTHTSLAPLFANVDFIQLMSYGAYFSGNTQVTLSALQTWVNGWVTNGFSISKIVIGMPAYARTPSDNSNIKYRTILTNFNPLPSQDTLTSNNKLYYYNGKTTIKNKTQYAVSNHLRGVMIWEAGQDTIPSYPMAILHSINEVIPVNPQMQTSISETKAIDKSLINVYPNPANDILNVNVPDAYVGKEAIVYDVFGKKIFSIVLKEKISKLNIKSYRKGVYFLRIGVETKSFVKE